LPNIRTEIDQSGKCGFSKPGDGDTGAAGSCRIDFVAAWNLFFLRFGFSGSSARFSCGRPEDHDQQAEGLKHNPRLMLIDDADGPRNGISR